MLKLARTGLALAPLVLAGCSRSPTESVLCLGVPSPAVEVEVLDSATLRPAGGGARGAVRDGAYRDSLVVIGWAGPQADESTALRMAAAWERPGSYTVEIERAGYAPWRRERVRASRGPCGVETVRLTARLRPLATLRR